MNALVKDIMTTPVVAVTRRATFKEMAATLHRCRVSAFPVIDEAGLVVGVVSEADLLTKEAVQLAREAQGTVTRAISDQVHRRDHRKAEGLVAGDLMSQPPVTITPDEPAEHAARLMYNCRVKRLPVVDEAGHLVGIVSRADVLSVFDRSDEQIRDEITDNLIMHEFLENPRQFAVTVRSGVVTVEGSPETAALGRDIMRRIRHVQGVVAVRDRLSHPVE
jgi:CBS domain-containing protein